MEYWIAFAIAALMFAASNRYHRAQVAELRRVMDNQFEGLRHNLDEVKELLKWIEPQLKMTPFNRVYVAARHTELRSIDDIRLAVDAGKYDSALLPVTEYDPRAKAS